MSDKIEVTGIELKINGKKYVLKVEAAWGLKRALDEMLRTESVPYPYPVYPPVAPIQPSIQNPYEPQWDYTTSDGMLRGTN